MQELSIIHCLTREKFSKDLRKSEWILSKYLRFWHNFFHNAFIVTKIPLKYIILVVFQQAMSLNAVLRPLVARYQKIYKNDPSYFTNCQLLCFIIYANKTALNATFGSLSLQQDQQQQQQLLQFLDLLSQVKTNTQQLNICNFTH